MKRYGSWASYLTSNIGSLLRLCFALTPVFLVRGGALFFGVLFLALAASLSRTCCLWISLCRMDQLLATSAQLAGLAKSATLNRGVRLISNPFGLISDDKGCMKPWPCFAPPAPREGRAWALAGDPVWPCGCGTALCPVTRHKTIPDSNDLR